MLKIKTTIKKYRNIFATFAVFILVVGSSAGLVGAQSMQQLREEIDGYSTEINQSEQHIEELRLRENTLQNRLEILEAETELIQSDIEMTEQEIAQTRREIREKEVELQRIKELIQENVKVLYKQGSPSTLEMLFSSDNFTDFINQQEYLDRAKDNLNEAARESVQIRTELEEKEEELNIHALRLNTQREELVIRQDEQKRLIEKTRGEEARYQALVKELRQKQLEADRKLAEAIAAASSGGLIGDGGAGGSGLLVNAGDVVVRGQQIAYVGSSGFSTGPHLDFMVYNSLGSTVSPNSPAGSFSTNLNYGFSWPVSYTNTVNVPYGSSLPCSQVYYPTCTSRGDTYAHYGIDIPAYLGEPVLAAASGKVVFSGWQGSAGFTIIIEHENGLRTRYSHLNS